jgi:hypothetical protein
MPPVGVLVFLMFFRERAIGALRGGPMPLGHKYDGGSARYGSLDGMAINLIFAVVFGANRTSLDLLLA